MDEKRWFEYIDGTRENGMRFATSDRGLCLLVNLGGTIWVVDKKWERMYLDPRSALAAIGAEYEKYEWFLRPEHGYASYQEMCEVNERTRQARAALLAVDRRKKPVRHATIASQEDDIERSRRGLILAFLLLAGVAQLGAETCRTVMLPESDGTGGQVTIKPSVAMPLDYTWWQYSPPKGAARVGLEFWSHAWPAGTPSASQFILVYLNRPDRPGRRMFHSWNLAPIPDGAVNFALSTWIHADETLVVVWLNWTPAPIVGYLIVTIRECSP